MEWIHISEVLADMERVLDEDTGRMAVFSIAWVRDNNGEGGPKGSIKRVAKASKHTRPYMKSSTQSKRPQNDPGKWQFKSYNGIPIVDLKTNAMLTPKYTHIVEYNGMKVRHYGGE
jgi:hypothetical protein